MVTKFLKLILILLLILLFFFPRSVELINGNPIFGFDQGREYLAVRDIVVNHNLILIGTELGAGSAGINGIFHGPGYYYMLSIPYLLFNGDPAGGTFFIFFLNLLALCLLVFFVKKILGTWPAVLSAFLFSISPFFISQARFLWSPNPPAFFILLSFFFTYLMGPKKNLYVFLAAFFAAFVYNFEMGMAIPMCICLLTYSFFIFKKKLRSYLFLISGFVTGFLPMILFEIRNNFLAVNGIISYLFGGRGDSSFQTRFVLDHFNAIIFNLNNTFGLEIILPQFLFYIPGILLLLLTFYYFRKERRKEIKNLLTYFAILVVTTFIVFLPLQNALYGYYLTDLSLAYIIIFCYITYSSFKNKEKEIYYPLVLFVIFIVVCSIPLQIKTTIADLKDYGGTAKIRGKIDAIDYIYKDAMRKPFGLLVFSPPVYTYPYDYLLWWHGEKKYGYIPYSDKKRTFYLLIESDPGKPWSYKGWLETVIKTGNVEWTKTLPSGFIVQKRITD